MVNEMDDAICFEQGDSGLSLSIRARQSDNASDNAPDTASFLPY
jgi:hypothetical protein